MVVGSGRQTEYRRGHQLYSAQLMPDPETLHVELPRDEEGIEEHRHGVAFCLCCGALAR